MKKYRELFFVSIYFVQGTYFVSQAKVLQEGSEQWKTFMKVPFPFQFKVHLFIVQNAEDIQAGAKPLVKEQGPYVYQ